MILFLFPVSCHVSRLAAAVAAAPIFLPSCVSLVVPFLSPLYASLLSFRRLVHLDFVLTVGPDLNDPFPGDAEELKKVDSLGSMNEDAPG